ncbi:MmgE/PrpD family protein, partial [Prauserella cavernicola]|uniref:MmgE/PrpD family protein n=1 Tax=Prauserella cavernicola TaxID=2800127 RepID=UPI0027DCC4D4
MDVVAAVSAGLTEGKGAVPGRAGTLAPLYAAFATGLAAHLDDYDDTHLSTVIHPGAVCLAVLVGLQDELADADAVEVLTDYAWGVDAE